VATRRLAATAAVTRSVATATSRKGGHTSGGRLHAGRPRTYGIARRVSLRVAPSLGLTQAGATWACHRAGIVLGANQSDAGPGSVANWASTPFRRATKRSGNLKRATPSDAEGSWVRPAGPNKEPPLGPCTERRLEVSGVGRGAIRARRGPLPGKPRRSAALAGEQARGPACGRRPRGRWS